MVEESIANAANDRSPPILGVRPICSEIQIPSPSPSFCTDKTPAPEHIASMTRNLTKIRVAALADAEAIANVHVTSWQEAYAGILPDQMLSDLNVVDRTKRWTSVISRKAGGREGSVFLALNERRAVGFVSVGQQRDIALRDKGFIGEIEALYVLAAAQRKGIGGDLIRQGAQHLLAQEQKAAALWVLEDNHPARSFYETIGARVIGFREDVRTDAPLSEVAYGWEDLSKDLLIPDEALFS